MTKVALHRWNPALLTWLFLLLNAHSQTQIPITLTATIPAAVDNGTGQYLRPYFEQDGESCGNANGIGFNFTYAMDWARNLPANAADNQYPYLYTYNFLNDGDSFNGTSHMYVDALNIAKENGIPNVTTWGGFDAGFDNYNWMTGYDKYYKAMQNRVDVIDSFSIADSLGLRKLKQWIFDHGDGSKTGGIGNFAVSVWASFGVPGWQFGKIASGPKSGEAISMIYGSDPGGDHAQTVIGYNDSIHFDFNKDGKFTNNIDQNGDGKITIADWEIGALHAVNTWSTDASDAGTNYWCPYRLLALAQDKGGLRNGNRATIATAKKQYTPKMALKISLTHSHRKEIALSVGVAPSRDATEPTKIRSFQKQFTYAGGDLPMCGQNASATIEIGLDVSDLIDSLAGAQEASFFLIVQSKGGNSGTVNSLSLMDYSAGAANEIKSTQTGVKANGNAMTYVKVAATVTTAVRKGNGVPHARRFESRRGGAGFQIRGHWTGTEKIGVLTLDGKLKASFVPAPGDTWYSLPRQLNPGAYLIRITEKNGATETNPVLLR
ncbi:MAG: hypothetical protein ABI036_10690 [Fibrobacteria bacterium]